MTGLTPAQLNVIRTWTEERDALLRDIGIYTTELDTLKESTKAGTASLTDIENRIAEARGRIAELNAIEERLRTSLSTEVAELEARKSRLESECEAKQKELDVFDFRKKEKIGDIETLVIVHDKMADQATIVEQIVGQVIAVSTESIAEIKNVMANIRSVAVEVIDKGNENVKQTGIILEKLPKYIFELQKPIRIRRVFAAPDGMVIEPDVPLQLEDIKPME